LFCFAEGYVQIKTSAVRTRPKEAKALFCVAEDNWGQLATQTSAKPTQGVWGLAPGKEPLLTVFFLVSELYPTKRAQQVSDDGSLDKTLNDWGVHLSLIISNASPKNTEAILSLGKELLKCGYVEAAHVW
jgi:hypothetical protein